ncbi:keratin, type II cytoskeletal 75 [Pelobates cultripes]|uniref:Keratin, type II cytoskeletal 75 n=1 Tax=Pelobates cultripes TaxID=61616 RepID=A0AAD1VM63_PELCU|nr:keratin, type II cytoskeletal 75 [Pelobates cultripes]
MLDLALDLLLVELVVALASVMDLVVDMVLVVDTMLDLVLEVDLVQAVDMVPDLVAVLGFVLLASHLLPLTKAFLHHSTWRLIQIFKGYEDKINKRTAAENDFVVLKKYEELRISSGKHRDDLRNTKNEIAEHNRVINRIKGEIDNVKEQLSSNTPFMSGNMHFVQLLCLA